MTKLKLGWVLTVAAIWLWQPVLASEDSSENPFPDGFDFDQIDDTPSQQESRISTPTSEDDIISDSPTSAKKTLGLTGTAVPQPQTPSPSRVIAPGRIINAPRDQKDKAASNLSGTDDEDSIATKTTLTDTLKTDENNSPIKGTWVEKITSSNPLSLLTSSDEDNDTENTQSADSLETMVKKSRNKKDNGKSNAAVFDISGVMLRMNLKQTERTLENRGFRKINAKFQIPNFIKWRNEEACRTEGIVGYERLEACVVAKAKKEKHQYVQYLKYAKFDSKEEIEIYLTSNFTENKVYKIVYESRIANLTGNSPKAIYIRNIKVYDFWKKISQKYGSPDDKNAVTWGLGGDKAYLKASTGHLILEDPMFRELDYTRMSREDQRFINSDFYNF